MAYRVRFVGASLATAVMGLTCLPAAVAATPSPIPAPVVASPVDAGRQITSPFTYQSARFISPPGRITLGQTVHMGVASVRPNFKMTYMVHHRHMAKVKTSSLGAAKFSYKPSKLGMVVMTVLGQDKAGRGFGRTFRVLVVAPKKHRAAPRAATVTSHLTSGATTSSAVIASPSVVTATLASEASLPSSGVSLDGGDLALLGLGLLGVSGSVGGLVVGGLVGRRSKIAGA